MRLRLLTAIATVLLGFAGASALTVTVLQTDGNKVFIDLDEQPVVTFTVDDMVFTTSATEFSLPLATIRQVTYEKLLNSIDELKATGIHVSQQGNTIVARGLKAGGQLLLFAIDGRLLGTARVDSEGTAQISLDTFQQGVYVLKSNELTFKALKR